MGRAIYRFHKDFQMVYHHHPLKLHVVDPKKVALGLYLTDHPITAYKQFTSGCRRTSEIASIGDGEHRVAGLTTFYPNVSPKTGNPYAKVNIEDEDGTISIFFFGRKYDEVLPIIQSNGPMIITFDKRQVFCYLFTFPRTKNKNV